MGQRSIRFPEELVAAIEAEAREQDRSFSWVVVSCCRAVLVGRGRGVEALEQALSSGSRSTGGSPRSVQSSSVAASARASERSVVDASPPASGGFAEVPVSAPEPFDCEFCGTKGVVEPVVDCPRAQCAQWDELYWQPGDAEKAGPAPPKIARRHWAS